MRVECKCNEKCQNALWIEEGSYLWVRWTNKDDTTDEKQILRDLNLDKLVEVRDMLNKVITEKAGL